MRHAAARANEPGKKPHATPSRGLSRRQRGVPSRAGGPARPKPSASGPGRATKRRDPDRGGGTWGAPRIGGIRSAALDAVAGSAFAVGIVALVEFTGLLTAGTTATWGPVATLAAGVTMAATGLPSALLVESVTESRGQRTLAITAVAYLTVTIVWSLVLWSVWRWQVDPTLAPLALFNEQLIILAAAVAVWGGARIAQRRRPAIPLLIAAVAVMVLVLSSAVVTLMG
ncbi:hypothetical protein ER308_20280 [Egibacter rhizosphaerae]|uniref:Uncharacterized protein n=1 Tax=Egibacter rhizosphaerae TaxID=1670831 RepID=A0A411YKG1_9ACTN|nr:hypothetical protein [Egibacter rhizosphaerae]QBI21673.1 hypothetical protein ER308_20280 [Egibacter rhizosphaerae]